MIDFNLELEKDFSYSSLTAKSGFYSKKTFRFYKFPIISKPKGEIKNSSS